MNASVAAPDRSRLDRACADPLAAGAAYRHPQASDADRDAALLVVVDAYRRDAKWSALLLELLAEDMAKGLRVFEPRPPVISAADIRLQLVLEVLWAAPRMPLPSDARRVGYRIVRRAGWSVNRWLRREARYQNMIAPLPEVDDDEAEEEEE